MKRLWMIGILLLLTGCAAREPAPPPEPVRVACVGDSITYGFGIADRTQTYPAQLQTLLGDGYVVDNFGVNGITALDYPATVAYQASLDFDPNLVVLMLGTNDCGGPGWQGPELFRTQYEDLVTDYLDRGCDLILCTPSTVYAGGAAYEYTPMTQTCEVVAQVAADYDLPLVDIHALTAGHPDWYADGLHPDANGAAVMAQAVADCMKKTG